MQVEFRYCITSFNKLRPVSTAVSLTEVSPSLKREKSHSMSECCLSDFLYSLPCLHLMPICSLSGRKSFHRNKILHYLTDPPNSYNLHIWNSISFLSWSRNPISLSSIEYRRGVLTSFSYKLTRVSVLNFPNVFGFYILSNTDFKGDFICYKKLRWLMVVERCIQKIFLFRS